MAPAIMDREELTTMTDELNLSDIPDFSGISESSDTFEAWADGWYEGTILGKREFTDSNGNDRVFESGDTPSASGAGRNIRLQIQVKRSDGRMINLTKLVNYRSEDLTAETVQAVTAQQQRMKEGTDKQWGNMFRQFSVLSQLGQLQKIAGVRQLQRNPEGGLDLTPLYDKTAYFRLVPDDRNPSFKMIKEFKAEKPVRSKVQ